MYNESLEKVVTERRERQRGRKREEREAEKWRQRETGNEKIFLVSYQWSKGYLQGYFNNLCQGSMNIM